MTRQRRPVAYAPLASGNSSVGRAVPCQGTGRRFEPAFPLQILPPLTDVLRTSPSGVANAARWQSGHAAACKAVYAGSIPTLASTPRRPTMLPSPGGGTGRRYGLKIRWPERAVPVRLRPWAPGTARVSAGFLIPQSKRPAGANPRGARSACRRGESRRIRGFVCVPHHPGFHPKSCFLKRLWVHLKIPDAGVCALGKMTLKVQCQLYHGAFDLLPDGVLLEWSAVNTSAKGLAQVHVVMPASTKTVKPQSFLAHHVKSRRRAPSDLQRFPINPDLNVLLNTVSNDATTGPKEAVA